MQAELIFSKPQIKNREQRIKIVLEYLMNHDFVTKPELCELFGWKYDSNKDRIVRDLVAELALQYPIISTSDTNKGYKLAKDFSEVDEVTHTWREIDSRIEELEKRRKPLIEFYEVAKRNGN